MLGHGLGLVAVSMPRGSFRNAINAGLPFLNGCAGVGELCETSDLLEVDFSTGRFTNQTRSEEHHFSPLPPELRSIIAAGGWKSQFKQRLAALRPSA
jgi:3-isopropylmalate/(R)-2-methylmalate dehydratase small subunit